MAVPPPASAPQQLSTLPPMISDPDKPEPENTVTPQDSHVGQEKFNLKNNSQKRSWDLYSPPFLLPDQDEKKDVGSIETFKTH